MHDYRVFIGPLIFFVPLFLFALWAGREEERQYRRRKDEGWYL
jgi:hypothetical protein